MRARVTNAARSARGFATLDRGIVMLEPGASEALDLADHPIHRAWEEAGEAIISPDETGVPELSTEGEVPKPASVLEPPPPARRPAVRRKRKRAVALL